MNLSLGISLTKSNKGGFTPTQILVEAFKARVIAASGTFESKACLDAQLVILNNIA